ncbi:MAG: 16S rRNA (guanine(527)-N(7))-methyltransferase RsmG [Jaaginema sp. PMC 1079.18]|nr:16S rRNA (guanine(527)-N(7))-methyltransferase RsmG [Jaaginema sp. PMC 1080.18]MEC4850136.1 16S rRNA (guanine(527)-N(7))-methyltransferase RsmG [Jaaginema sp. PMC 1079.18]MEC4866342.1 16S rRNA (guanine(527)-N(7))-methyltransferase RsmG [Jaaginema sp. PMC 1078.18]
MQAQPPTQLPDFEEIWQATLQWQPDSTQKVLFERLYEGILQGNQHLNLTRITDPVAFWEKHLWDSLSGIAPWLNTEESKTVVDIGTGAGFPGLPVAIARPQDYVTLLDSTRKKIAFLDHLVAELGLTQVTPLAVRAEALNPQDWSLDVALVRAVSTAANCTAYTLPLLKPGGVAVLYRGRWSAAEAQEVSRTALQYGGTLESVVQLSLPLTQGIRHCVYVRKQDG